jgi:DNA-binding protein H-NS
MVKCGVSIQQRPLHSGGKRAQRSSGPATGSCTGPRAVLDERSLTLFTYGVIVKQFSSMNVDELLAVKAKIEAAIASRIAQERKRLTASLERLNSLANKTNGASAKVRVNGLTKRKTLAAKYRNPTNPRETWAGRGHKPRWLVAALKGGKKKLIDFQIDRIGRGSA